MSHSKFTISGSGTSNSIISGQYTALREFNTFVKTQQLKNLMMEVNTDDDKNLMDVKIADNLYGKEDLLCLAQDKTFEDFAYYLVETAQANVLNQLSKGTFNEAIEIDDRGDFKALGTVKQYFSNLQNKLVSLDKNKEIRYFDQFRMQLNGAAPLFIHNIRSEITKRMMRFLISHGIAVTIKPVGMSKKNLKILIQHILSQGITINISYLNCIL